MNSGILKGNRVRVEETVRVVQVFHGLDRFTADMGDELANINPEALTNRRNIVQRRLLQIPVRSRQRLSRSLRAKASVDRVEDNVRSLAFDANVVSLNNRDTLVRVDNGLVGMIEIVVVVGVDQAAYFHAIKPLKSADLTYVLRIWRGIDACYRP